jgi:hypothetical protein
MTEDKTEQGKRPEPKPFGRLLSRDQIAGIQDLKSEVVPIPEWSGDVTVMEFNGATRAELDKRFKEAKDKDEKNLPLLCWMVVVSVVDGQGQRMFKPEDVEMLVGKNMKPILRIVKVVKRLNALDDLSVEDEAKNS